MYFQENLKFSRYIASILHFSFKNHVLGVIKHSIHQSNFLQILCNCISLI